MEQRGREKDSWELVENAIDAEAKAGLQPSSFVRDMDQRCPRGNRPAYTTVAKSQASTRDSRDEPSASSAWDPPDEPSEKDQDEPPRFLQSENGKPSAKKARKEKKKKQRCQEAEQARRESTPATRANTTNANVARKDLSQITCYNCDEKGHYARNCPEPDRDASED